MSDFSLLTHALPTSIDVDGVSYAIDPRTTKALQCFLISEDDSVPLYVRMSVVVQNMIPSWQALKPEQTEDAYKSLCSFLGGYPAQRKRRKDNKQTLSYEQDHALIVASFRQAYGLSLQDIKALHWWEFLALLSGLPADTRLAGVMDIRGMDINPKDSAEVRMAKIKAKQDVALRPKKKQTDMRGEDIISQALSEEI